MSATILLVDDNSLTRKMVRLALETRGHEVIEAVDGCSALRLVGSRPVDLILQDLMLPDVDGFELVTRLRALPHGANASIVAFSGLLSKFEEAQVAALGFDDVIVKPIDPSRLVPILESHLLGPTAPEHLGLGRRLILADDDPLQLKLTRFRLERMGFAVELARDGQEAFEAARRNKPDGVVSDVLMPRLDGFGLALAIRQDPELRLVPVLLVTSSYVDESDRELARRVGANDLIVRTPDQRELVPALRAMLRGPAPVVQSSFTPPFELERERSGRVVHQLERQVTLNSGLAQRCSTLAAELAVLSGISEAVVRHQDLETALDETLAACLDVGGISAGALYLLNEKQELAVRRIARGDRATTDDLASFFGRTDLLRGAIASGSPCALAAPQFPSAWAESVLRSCEATFAILVPLVLRDGPVGALFTAVRAREPHEEDWKVFVQGIGNQIAQALSLASTFAEKEKAEHEAREQASFLELILDSIGDGVIATDSSGRVVRMNRVACQLTGWQPGDALGRPLEEVFCVVDHVNGKRLEHRIDAARDVSAITEFAEDGVLLSRDGRQFPISDGDAPIRDAGGGQRGVVVVFRDMTRAREGERALRESEARFRSTFEQAAVGVAHIAPDGRWLEVNQHLCEIVGYSRGELLQRSFQDVTHPEDLAADLKAMGQMQSGELTTYSLEKRCTRSDAETVWVHLTMSLVRVEDGTPKYFICVLQDISQRKRTEEELARTAQQLRQSQKLEAIGQLAGGVAHDFNNLLSVILSYSTMLLQDAPAGGPMRADLEQIAEASQRAASLTRQLLMFSRRQVLAPRILEVNETIDGLGKMLERLIGENIELSFALSATGRVHVDPGQLEQVLINLVVNARDAMTDGGRVAVKTSDVQVGVDPGSEKLGLEPGRYTAISVSDTGIGVDPEIQSRIFEPFFTTKGVGKGTGLGLSTVFGIVKQSGGEVSVVSRPGEGATFTVYLPRVDGPPRASEAPEANGPGPRGAETVLLVEDDEQVRTVVKTILERQGYAVLDAASAGDAVVICEQFHGTIHLLLTDVVMPRMNGRELAERVHRLRPKMKVIFMSGYTDDAIVHHGVFNAGMHFIQKPVTPNPLLAKVRDVLDYDARHASTSVDTPHSE